ncbi:FKBP-type peptidyl-prolyl cis-trans isomerase [Wenyingzhuangia marina]|uniref:Peptidyl-prolyl cis-trans isomerase n=1 Tax=Wenyingzhuangia marina TaxID=1195760 RepID=A0A1M5UJG6_9FLAO|nr:FKBP-type peptidyl-prolyl cis-trans isomerase [Wenyingzhuangia marina]GGF67255.1 hypothetical protein GCM10011397_07940 [Wenyingzhuangia marina]SHH63184.1 FKBP-type peptidyl-prolyl cis-trans isomerase [Wenyingzhuangia marina]
MNKIILAITSFILLTSCLKDDSPKDYTSENEEDIQKYLTDNNLQATKDEYGVYYVIEEEGTGTQPETSNVVKLNYKGRVLNGKVFSKAEDKPAYLQIEKIIQGLGFGLSHFKAGGSGKIIIPSKLGYGNVSFTNIPEGSVLVFDIELIDIFSNIEEANDDEIMEYLAEEEITEYTKTSSGLYYIIEQEGTGETPEPTDNVTVAYKGYFTSGTVFDESSVSGVSFDLKEVIEGWTEGITYFKKGGSGKLFIPSNLGYGSNNNRGIPGGSVLIFDIKLVSIN